MRPLLHYCEGYNILSTILEKTPRGFASTVPNHALRRAKWQLSPTLAEFLKHADKKNGRVRQHNLPHSQPAYHRSDLRSTASAAKNSCQIWVNVPQTWQQTALSEAFLPGSSAV